MAGRVSLAQPNTEFYWMSLALALSDRQSRVLRSPHPSLVSYPTLSWHLPLLFTGLDDP